MKKWSIRTKITLLFTVALTLMATLSCLIVFSVSHQVIQKTVRDNLDLCQDFGHKKLNFSLLT